MTIARRKLTAVDKLKIVVAQAKCSLCGESLVNLSEVDFDHAHALALGGADEIENLRAVHRECHAVKTRGAGATTAGSDIGKMKKLRHLVAKETAFRERVLAKGGRAVEAKIKPRAGKRAWPSRPFPNRKRSKL
ncbi:hypothetical protein ASE61_00740 [Bosea sp. Root670]|nr:hypothetical protein ASE61_00740 [Bosea sp. Root670]